MTQNSACPPNCSMKPSSQPSSYNRQSGQLQTEFTLHQCCGSGDIYPVFRIQFFLSQIPDPSSRTYKIPDPGSQDLGSRIQIRIKEFKYLPKKLFLSSRKNDLGCSSRIPDLDFFPSRRIGIFFHPGSRIWIFFNPGSGSRIMGSKKHRIPDPGSGFAYTAYTRKMWRELHSGLYQEFSHLRDLLQNNFLSLLIQKNGALFLI